METNRHLWPIGKRWPPLEVIVAECPSCGWTFKRRACVIYDKWGYKMNVEELTPLLDPVLPCRRTAPGMRRCRIVWRTLKEYEDIVVNDPDPARK